MEVKSALIILSKSVLHDGDAARIYCLNRNVTYTGYIVYVGNLWGGGCHGYDGRCVCGRVPTAVSGG